MLGRFDRGLEKCPANYQPLSPLGFLERAATTFPAREAIRYGSLSRSYAELYERTRRLASALEAHGVTRGDTVSVLAPNVPALLEAHYGVPMAGAVLNAMNTRLDAPALAYMIDHGRTKLWMVDAELWPLAQQALERAQHRPTLVAIEDPEAGHRAPPEALTYEALLSRGDPDYAWCGPADEWDAIALNYTSGTTGRPKGVVYHHRGAYLLAMGNVISARMSGDSRHLWTVPMFHCNGWCFTWGLAVVGATHVCLRRVDPADIYAAIEQAGVTHMGGAPVVLGMLVQHAAGRKLPRTVEVATGGAPPPSSVIAAMEELGFRITHLYGLTETYGPSVVNAWHGEWDALPPDERAALKARQGVRHQALEALSVRDPETLDSVPHDGQTVGEVMFRGNIVMKGYLDDAEATAEAFRGGWFHSGDLGVCHPDGYVQLTDRAKDIIISGGENISSIEVENTLYTHPAVLEAAVVARPDARWGETPCAFVSLSPSATDVDEAALIDYCRERLAHFKCPRHVIFGDLPKTATGKIQKYVLRERARASAEP